MILSYDTSKPEASLYGNGSLVHRRTAAIPTGFAYDASGVARLGYQVGGPYRDISKPLFVALIDGALTQKEVLIYSRWLKDVFNLPISI